MASLPTLRHAHGESLPPCAKRACLAEVDLFELPCTFNRFGRWSRAMDNVGHQVHVGGRGEALAARAELLYHLEHTGCRGAHAERLSVERLTNSIGESRSFNGRGRRMGRHLCDRRDAARPDAGGGGGGRVGRRRSQEECCACMCVSPVPVVWCRAAWFFSLCLLHSFPCCCRRFWPLHVLTSAAELPPSAGGPGQCSEGMLGGQEAAGCAPTVSDPCRVAVCCRIKKCTIRAVRVSRKVIFMS